MKILVVEDEAAIRFNIAQLLKMEKFEVVSAENGRIGAELARREHPDLIVSDVTMPDMDGYALLNALRGDPSTAAIPFLFLTAKADVADFREGMNRGADDYLIKPFKRDELLAAIRARLEKHAIQHRAVRRLEKQAQHLLHYDILTDLPNRALFQSQLNAALKQAERDGTLSAIVLIGLDGFRKVNDSLGHAVGDMVLRETSNRLFRIVNEAVSTSPYDLIARLSNDVFAIAVNELPEPELASIWARAAQEALSKPYRVADQDLYLTASIGIALYPRDGDNDESLLQHAEIALNTAKERGAGRQEFFSAEMNERVNNRLRLHNDLHRAIDNGEFLLEYQPKVSFNGHQIVGFEALVRWNHPVNGFVPPAEFIPIAEENGQIVHIGAWVLQTACAQMKHWYDRGRTDLSMAINLSVKQFGDPALPALVRRVLADTGLPPSRLELEITESIALQSAENTLRMLEELKAIGVTLAMDDFGTGYSSLSYLKRFPLDVLKIDQSFVRNLTTDAGDLAITRAIIAMARSFDLIVVAEGVETQQHVNQLHQLGCDLYQGYHFSRPRPAAEIDLMIFGGGTESPIAGPTGS